MNRRWFQIGLIAALLFVLAWKLAPTFSPAVPYPKAVPVRIAVGLDGLCLANKGDTEIKEAEVRIQSRGEWWTRRIQNLGVGEARGMLYRGFTNATGGQLAEAVYNPPEIQVLSDDLVPFVYKSHEAAQQGADKNWGKRLTELFPEIQTNAVTLYR